MQILDGDLIITQHDRAKSTHSRNTIRYSTLNWDFNKSPDECYTAKTDL